MKSTIGAVIVTFNRLEKLKKALASFDRQSYQPSYILVVDNASDDGTGDYLKEWLHEEKCYKKYISVLPRNTGGSGGFYTGLKRAVKLSANWIWVSDDDVYLKPDTLEKSVEYIEKLSENPINGSNVSAIASKVLRDGVIDIAHRKKVEYSRFYAREEKCPIELYNKDYFTIDILSFAGSILNKNAVLSVGLPEKDFFIWFDDSEYSYRLNKFGKMYVVPSVEIIHDDEQAYGGSNITWKDYYGSRNEIYTFKKHYNKRIACLKVLKKTVKAMCMFFNKKTRQRSILLLCGILDGVKGKLGVHTVYKPGWKVKTNR